MRSALFVSVLLAAAVLVGVVGHGSANDSDYFGPFLKGYGLDGLPKNPTIQQQIDAGKKQIAAFREYEDQSLDRDGDAVEYLNEIEAALLKSYDGKVPYPIQIHVSTGPVPSIASSWAGGQILVGEAIFESCDKESELVGVIAHETAHELHNDFATKWNDFEEDKLTYGTGGTLEESRNIEAQADETGAQLMYAAGWNPQGMVDYFKHFPDGRVWRSTHPANFQRVNVLSERIGKFPAKADLKDDSPKFQELKREY